MSGASGALLVNKHVGVTSFGVIELLQEELGGRLAIKRRDMPKIGHGGTLDPFATGLMVVCVGRAVKLARYFLGAPKHYRGVFKFGETTLPGDPTAPVTERSEVLPESRERIDELAKRLCAQPYLQTPPMHSAKKVGGRPLYELAREGLEVEREPKLCHLYRFGITSYDPPRAGFELSCSSGTYVRTLAQDMGRMLGTVALLETLERVGSGDFRLAQAMTVAEIGEACKSGQGWADLPCWIPFDRLLDGFDYAEATEAEARALVQGRQGVLFEILKRARPRGASVHGTGTSVGARRAELGEWPCVGIYQRDRLLAVARHQDGTWKLDGVYGQGR